MSGAEDKVGLVVNYFTRFGDEDARRLLVATTSTALRLVRRSPRIGQILLVDGSERPDPDMRRACEEIGVDYRHYGMRLSYVAAYNRGWRELTEPYVALMANDILVHPPWTIDRLADWIARPDVGCVFPYMASTRRGGDETQRLGFFRRGRLTCEPTTMTLNLNLFKREVLEAIGGLDENYLYGFAEPILLLKIRPLGYRAVLVGGTQVHHLDQLTKTLDETTLTYPMLEADRERWVREHPSHASDRGLANIDPARWPFATNRRIAVVWSLTQRLSSDRLRRLATAFVLWLEPALTRYPSGSRKRGA